MAKAREREEAIVEIDADSELAKALASAGEKPVTIVSNGLRYVATRDPDDLWADYDPETVREALRAAAGTLTPEEGERLKQDIYRWREEGSRPMNQITASRTADDEVWAELGAMPAVAEAPIPDEPLGREMEMEPTGRSRTPCGKPSLRAASIGRSHVGRRNGDLDA